MNFTSLWDFIGRASQWFFIHFMEKIRWMPNAFFITVGFIAFFIWMSMMAKYNREAAENNTLK
ncbi:MAG TPA: hypothetical protein VI112_07170 [Bacteroidia bacterium]|jgi:hypothetical protein